MRQELINNLVVTFGPHIKDMTAQDLKMRIEMALAPYDISKSERALTVYEGDVNNVILKRFLAAKIAEGCSAKTIQYYKTTVIKVLQAIGKPYMDITADDVRLYIAIRVQRDKVAKTSADNERRVLSSFYGWLQNEEILGRNPMKNVDAIKVKKIKKKAYSLLDLEKIRVGCRTNRERAIVEMLASTWCRVNELVQIRKDEIRDGKVIVHGKGDKDREVYINARAQLALECYLQERQDTNPYLFPKMAGAGNVGEFKKKSKNSDAKCADWYKNPEFVDPYEPTGSGTIERIVRDLGLRAGVEKAHPHRFRRTGATMALRQGMPLTTVSKLLGHANISTTQIYLDISDEELEQAHRKYVT